MGFFTKKKKTGFLGKKKPSPKEKPKAEPVKEPVKKAAPLPSKEEEETKISKVVAVPLYHHKEEEDKILTAEGFRRMMLKRKKSH
jgi:hypothetical protein